MRYVWLTIGWVSVVLGVAGIPLPLLPTTPFLLLAAFSFAKSSPRFHAWLLDHPKLGPQIKDWHDRRAIRPRAKLAAMAALIASFGISLALGFDSRILAVQAVALLGVAAFILTRNSA